MWWWRQLIGLVLGWCDGQEIDIEVGIPVTAGQLAEHPPLCIDATRHNGLGHLTQCMEPGEAALLSDGGEGAHGATLGRMV